MFSLFFVFLSVCSMRRVGCFSAYSTTVELPSPWFGGEVLGRLQPRSMQHPAGSFKCTCAWPLGARCVQVLEYPSFEGIARLYKAITAIQCGEAADKYGLTRVVGEKAHA